MTYERRITTTRSDTDVAPVAEPAAPVAPVAQTASTSSVVERSQVEPSGGEMLRRGVVLVFGLIQTLISLRIVLLLLNAREGNDLVAFILSLSQVFVSPFIGIFNTDALRESGSILDIAAIAALVGWTILEMIVLWAVNLVKREPV
jgi:hypothetical protein